LFQQVHDLLVEEADAYVDAILAKAPSELRSVASDQSSDA
jgi:hypothetical protein